MTSLEENERTTLLFLFVRPFTIDIKTTHKVPFKSRTFRDKKTLPDPRHRSHHHHLYVSVFTFSFFLPSFLFPFLCSGRATDILGRLLHPISGECLMRIWGRVASSSILAMAACESCLKNLPPSKRESKRRMNFSSLYVTTITERRTSGTVELFQSPLITSSSQRLLWPGRRFTISSPIQLYLILSKYIITQTPLASRLVVSLVPLHHCELQRREESEEDTKRRVIHLHHKKEQDKMTKCNDFALYAVYYWWALFLLSFKSNKLNLP